MSVNKKQGFFTAVEEENKEKKKNKYTCSFCNLDKQCKSPRITYSGEGKLSILGIGEAPGKIEDEEETQFVGEAGQLWRKKLRKFDLDLDRDFWKDNVLQCRPPRNREPTDKEIKCCRFHIDKVIEEQKPKYIWLLGNAAIKSFYLGKFSRLAITRWRGHFIPDKRYNAFIIPLFHPSFILRNKDDKNLISVYDRDLKKAVSFVREDRKLQFESYEDKVRILKSNDEIKSILTKIKNSNNILFFDYETNRIKPYRDRAKIITVSVYYDGYSYSFPFIKDGLSLWTEIMKSKVPKVVHNIGFEDIWTRIILGCKVENFIWDTMIAQHVLDDRRGISGLKFQSYVRYGVEDYSESIKKYMKEDSEGYNKLEEAPVDDLLKYNAMDVLMTRKLYYDQKEEMDNKLLKANKLFFDGVFALSDLQEEGIDIDVSYYKEKYRELTEEQERINNFLFESREARRFRRKYKREIKWNSSKDLKELLFNMLRIVPVKMTKKKNYSVDQSVLSGIKNESIEKLLILKKILKLKDTYLKQFFDNEYKNKIHPTFNLHIARSFRSSADRPNLQNIPVREEKARIVTRGGIIPNKGYRLLEVDYKAIEVRVAAMYSEDPVLIKYIKDSKTDMHRDQAMKIFLLPQKDITKELRYAGKNGFVFPQFYGSNYKECTKNIWNDYVVGNDYLMDNYVGYNINDYIGFERHIRDVENEFWSMLKVLRQWQNKIERDYRKKGYVETLFGFRRGGYLKRNEIMNTPIQATAFHILLWCLIRLNEIRKRQQWLSKLIGQIHDSILSNLHPDEEKSVIRMFRKVMTRDVVNENLFITVPLEVEFEITDIDEAWVYKSEMEVKNGTVQKILNS